MSIKFKTGLMLILVSTGVLPGGAVICFGADGHCAIESLYAKGCSQCTPPGDRPDICSKPVCYDLSIPDMTSYPVAARKTIEIPAITMDYHVPILSDAFSGYWFDEPVRQWNPGDLHAFRDTVILRN